MKDQIGIQSSVELFPLSRVEIGPKIVTSCRNTTMLAKKGWGKREVQLLGGRISRSRQRRHSYGFADIESRQME